MQNFKSTPDSLKHIFKVFGRKPSLGAPVGMAFQIKFPIPRAKKMFKCPGYAQIGGEGGGGMLMFRIDRRIKATFGYSMFRTALNRDHTENFYLCLTSRLVSL